TGALVTRVSWCAGPIEPARIRFARAEQPVAFRLIRSLVLLACFQLIEREVHRPLDRNADEALFGRRAVAGQKCLVRKLPLTDVLAGDPGQAVDLFEARRNREPA